MDWMVPGGREVVGGVLAKRCGAVTKYLFRLFAAGNAERSAAAEENLRAPCESLVPGGCELEVIDARDRPDLAGQQHVLAAPAAIGVAPAPERRAMGDLDGRRPLARAPGIAGRSGVPARGEGE